MTPNQSLPTNKTAHIIPASSAKPGSVVVGTVTTPRATTIVSTAQRKRDTGKRFIQNPFQKSIKLEMDNLLKSFLLVQIFVLKLCNSCRQASEHHRQFRDQAHRMAQQQ